MRIIKIANLFIKTNFKKTLSAILTLTSFLLVLNILLGILFSVTGIFNSSIVKNSSVHFMEIVNNGDIAETFEIKKTVDATQHITSNFIDTSHPVIVPCNNDDGMELYTLIGLPKNMLNAIGLNTDSEKYLFLPSSDSDYFSGMDTVQFEETLYVRQNDGSIEPVITDFTYTITGYFDPIEWDLFPDNIAIIDETTATQIAEGMVVEGTTPSSDRIIAWVSEVAYQQDIQTSIESIHPNVDVRYSLKYTGKLPEYATVMIAVSGIIIAILLLFCFINIRSSVKQALIQRQRDIGLLSIFGMTSNNISAIFLTEFIVYSLVAFALSSVATVLLFCILKIVFSFDLLTGYLPIYVITNAIISVIMFVCIAAFQIKHALFKLNTGKIYKDMLK